VIISVDPSSAVPPYEQVRAAIAAAVDDGSLSPGARLPTVRELAGNLALAPNTVARAYRELESVGVIETRGRRGTFVAAPPEDPAAAARLAAQAYADRCREVGIDREDALALVQMALRLAPQSATVSTPASRRRRAPSADRTTTTTETPQLGWTQ
jgi:DNA-binding transcriptional regulator YhcF (GntR family)